MRKSLGICEVYHQGISRWTWRKKKRWASEGMLGQTKQEDAESLNARSRTDGDNWVFIDRFTVLNAISARQIKLTDEFWPCCQFTRETSNDLSHHKGIQIIFWLKLWPATCLITLTLWLATLRHCFILLRNILMLNSHKTKHIPWCLVRKKNEWKRKLKRGVENRKKFSTKGGFK